MGSGDSDDLFGRGHHQDGAAGPALVVGVHPVVGLLFPDEIQGFVLAGQVIGRRGETGYRDLASETCDPPEGGRS